MNWNATKYFKRKKKEKGDFHSKLKPAQIGKKTQKNSCASLGLAQAPGAGGGLSSPWEAGKSQQIGISL